MVCLSVDQLIGRVDHFHLQGFPAVLSPIIARGRDFCVLVKTDLRVSYREILTEIHGLAIKGKTYRIHSKGPNTCVCS